jgi:PAS domain S-box-containing protein/diguanylate cyclase (GGDEF)-like protein
LFETFAEQAIDAILFIEHPPEGGRARIVYANPAFERISGYRACEVQNLPPIELLLREDLHSDTISAIRGAAKMLSPLSIEFTKYRKDGTPVVVDLALSPIFNEHGACTHWVAACRDITTKQRVTLAAERRRTEIELREHISQETVERERVQQTLRYLAFHDVLTGLPNRSLLLQQVASALLEGGCGTLLSLQVERFEAIAAALGHKGADELLAQASKRMRAALAPGAALARLDAGTFAAWLPGVCDPEAREFVDAILESLTDSFVVDGERIALRAHVGIASAASGSYATPEEILRDAEIAAQAAAKANARYRRFSPRLHEHSLTRLRVEFQLHRAIARGQFVCHFQPIADLVRDRIAGFEALVRWHDPERGLVPPDAFIPIAEESGDIVRIGELVLQIACREAAQWPQTGGRDLVVNVNVSARQLDDEQFAQKVFATLRNTGLPAHRLCLEITETAFAMDEQAVLETLRTLRDAGVGVALDDFGIGYSSLGSLRRLPFTSVKIDRSFISAHSGDEREGIADESIVQMIVALGRTRRLWVAAEGVETAMQLRAASDLGCTHAQGYFIARPMPAEDVAAWLNSVPDVWHLSRA